VAGGPLTITVRRTADGFASNWLCEHVRPGDTLRVLPPSGTFSPASLDADLLLLAAGSGITPVISIVRTVLERGTGRMVLLYANRDESSVIFAAELAALAAAHPDRLKVVHWLESVQGLPTREGVRVFAAAYLSWDAFVCGPAGFLELAVAALRELGFPRARRHQERFLSLDDNPFGDPSAEDDGPGPEIVGRGGPSRLEVELDGREHAFDDWAPGTRMLDHLEAKGVPAPHSCRQGECAACAVRLVAGDVRMLANAVLSDADLAAGYRLGCQSVPLTDTVRVTYG
jgi:3-ketosteroid 9alpha-monooxygenase subunit B